MNDAQISAFVAKTIAEEIVPVLDLPHDELSSFAQAVLSRFRNPFIQHQLLSIALNGITKFRTRILPQLLAYQQQQGELPARLTFALAALIAFYRGERNGEAYPLQDDQSWLDRYQTLWRGVTAGTTTLGELVRAVLSDTGHWQQDLLQVPGLAKQVEQQLQAILDRGMRDAVSAFPPIAET